MNALVKSVEVACPQYGLPRALLALRHILVVVDPAMPDPASLDKAARIALNTGAELELYACDVHAHETASLTERRSRHEGLLETLANLARPLRARGLAVRVTADRAASLEHAVGCHTIRTQPDLVIKDIRHDGVRACIGEADRVMVQELAAPLMLVSREPWPERMHIAVSVDPCHPAVRTPTLDEDMLATSFMLGDALQARIDVLHVLELPPHLPGEPVTTQQKLARQAAARAVVHSFVASANPQGLQVQTHFEEGVVARRIIEFAHAHQPQLLTIGVAPRPRWAYSAAADTSTKVLEALPCDLLVVKPPGFVSPLLVTEP